MHKSLHSQQHEILLTMLRTHREFQRLRQADVADRLGRDQATISKVEAGDRRLDILELRAWLAALGVDFLTFIKELDERLGHIVQVPDGHFRRKATAAAIAATRATHVFSPVVDERTAGRRRGVRRS